MKKAICIFTIFSISIFAFSFDWPMELATTDSIKSYFGQIRGNTLSTSIIIGKQEIKNEEESDNNAVRICEEGSVLAVIHSIDDDNDFFPSTLGNSIIITHEDNIISVYGNLLETSIPSSITENQTVENGSIIGQIGNSAWQENSDGLEFKIIDSKNKTAINPRIFLSRIEKEGTFVPSEIILESKDGKKQELAQNKSFQAGNYKFYQKRNDFLVPLKMSLAVNGEVLDEYSFDMVIQEDNSIYVNGKTRKYPCKTIYSDNKLFIGEARLTPGKSVLTFENTNHLGDKRIVNYNVTIY